MCLRLAGVLQALRAEGRAQGGSLERPGIYILNSSNLTSGSKDKKEE